jgi:hypothetical protein
MPTNPQIDAPVTLTGLFPPDSEDEDEEDAGAPGEATVCFEVQSMTVAGETLKVRQYDFHSHNANCVWPGTFNLADYLFSSAEQAGTPSSASADNNSKSGAPIAGKSWGNVLELGTATGLLAIRLALACDLHCPSQHKKNSGHTVGTVQGLVTSDVADEHNEVFENVQHNYILNGIEDPPRHIPHTWGTGWADSVERAGGTANVPATFDTIVASDILLYVSAYPALVETLEELMPTPATTLVMSWNRRMKESSDFFARMEAAGFGYTHQGKCIYTFRRPQAAT